MNLKNNRKQKIALLLFSLEAGGAERVAATMVNHLAKNKEIHLILFNGPINYNLPKEVKLKTLRNIYSQRSIRLLTLPFIVFQLNKYLKQENINTVLSFDTLPNLINCISGFLGNKHTINLRESSHPTTRFSKSSLYGIIYRFLMKFFYKYADKIYVNTLLIKDNLRNNFGITVPIQLTPNPIDLKLIENQEGIPISSPNQFIFIQVANFYSVKNHHLTIEAFANLKPLNCQLWLIGKGELEPQLKQLVHQMSLSQRVIFLGYQANPFKYMTAANCMVLSSNYEGLPNVLIEGLACGLPIISTDCPSGPREIIAPETDYKKQVKNEIEVVEYGILTPVGNVDFLAEAMTKVYHNKSFQQPEKYKNRAKDFDVNVMLKDFGNLL